MSYDRQHLKFSFEFEALGTKEVAQTGFQMTGLTTFDAAAALAAVTEANLQSTQSALTTLMQTTPAIWGDYSQVASVKCAAIDTSGHYIGAAKEFAAIAPFTGTHANVPPQVSVVIGLWSGLKLGVANYGKMYLPHIQLPLDAGTPLVDVAYATALATSFAAFITGVNGLYGSLPGTPLVANLSKKGTGTTKGVTYVRVGQVLDTQRRRRDRLVENLQAHAV